MNENSILHLKLNVLNQFLIVKTRFLLLIFSFSRICGFSQTAVDRIDSLMKSWYIPTAPGAVIAIQQHHTTIFKKGYGLTDLVSGRPITADDNFNIGSLTKQFTAFALLK